MATNRKQNNEKEKKSPKKMISTKKRGDLKNYSLSDKYKVGEMIYHPVFDDTGKVIRKTRSYSGKYTKIIVQFMKVGKKKLIEGFEDTQ